MNVGSTTAHFDPTVGGQKMPHHVVRLPSWAIALMIIFAIGTVLSLRMVRKKRKYTKRQLERYRRWKAGDTEKMVASQITRLKEKLKGLRSRRQWETHRKHHEELLSLAEDIRDARGKEIYGDAWDTAEKGDAPLKDLFALSDDQVHRLQTQAKRRDKPQSLPDGVAFYSSPGEAFAAETTPLVQEASQDDDGVPETKHGATSPPRSGDKTFPVSEDGEVVPDVYKLKSRVSPRIVPFPPPPPPDTKKASLV